MVTIQLTDQHNRTLTVLCKNADTACDIAIAVSEVVVRDKNVETFIIRQMVKGKVINYMME